MTHDQPSTITLFFKRTRKSAGKRKNNSGRQKQTF